MTRGRSKAEPEGRGRAGLLGPAAGAGRASRSAASSPPRDAGGAEDNAVTTAIRWSETFLLRDRFLSWQRGRAEAARGSPRWEQRVTHRGQRVLKGVTVFSNTAQFCRETLSFSKGSEEVTDVCQFIKQKNQIAGGHCTEFRGSQRESFGGKWE